MSVIPDFFLDSIVSLGIKRVNPKTNILEFYSTGTGFLVFKYIDEQKGFAFLVTNRHVFKDKSVMYARFNHTDGRHEELETPLFDKDGKTLYINHPDESIDIAIMAINLDYLRNNQIIHSNFIMDKHALKISDMKNEGISEGSFIFSLGFPMNLVDIIKTPICRMGCISRIQDLYKDPSRKSFIIDTQVFPRNSGGPVITRPEVVSLTGTKSHSKSSLIGIVYAYIPYQETLVSLQDNKPRSIVQENSGLALAHPVDYIFDLIDIYMKDIKTKH